MSLLNSATILTQLFIFYAKATPLPGDSVANQTSFESSNAVQEYFRQQGSNPYGVVAVLLLVGGDVIQKAMAQQTGSKTSFFTPVAFSFGWVSYAFQCLASAMGSRVYMPPPENSSWVVNIESGDRRENRSWLLGRLLRDLELENAEADGAESPLIVTVYQLSTGPGIPKPKHPKRDLLWHSYWVVVLGQLFVASIPVWFHGWNDYSTLVIVGAGNVLALISASLSNMRREKFQGSPKGSNSSYALTRGNGHTHVFIILPNDIGGLSDPHTPSRRFSKLPHLDQMATARYQAGKWSYLLTDFPLALLWVILLIFVGNLNSHAWVLVAAGMLGTIHNVLVSAWPRDPAAHGLPLVEFSRGHSSSRFMGTSVMKVLTDVEREFPGAGHSLRPIFFPGRETKANKRLWTEEDVKFSTLKKRRADKWREHFDNGHNMGEGNRGAEHCCCAEACSCTPASQLLALLQSSADLSVTMPSVAVPSGDFSAVRSGRSG